MVHKQSAGPIEDYLSFRSHIDEEIKRLKELHGPDITCRSGCMVCCVNLTVFPVEFFAIREELRKTNIKHGDLHFNESAPCGFLNEEGLCRIYPFRPIICRTHGLPILFLDDSLEEPAWEVSFCELNFQNKTGIEFTEDMLLDIESINIELKRINSQFISSLTKERYSAHQRISLEDLCKNPQQR